MGIYIETGELSARPLSEAKTTVDRAADKLWKLIAEDGIRHEKYICPDGTRKALFPVDFEVRASELHARTAKLSKKLGALAELLRSGPAELVDIDEKQKNELVGWWERASCQTDRFLEEKKEGAAELFLKLFFTGGVSAAKTTVRVDAKTPQPRVYPTEYSLYRARADAVNRQVPVGQKQETEVTGTGLCTFSATTTLLMRKQAAEGRAVTFTFSDVHMVNDGSGQVRSDGLWPQCSFMWNRTYRAKDGSSYTMSYEFGNVSEGRMAKLLDAHPEGILVYAPSKGGKHAIVITDYEIRSDGTYQFYADDPVNDESGGRPDGRVRLEDTWLYSVNRDILGTTRNIAYFE